jgi:predicted amidohydrolase
MGRVRLNLSDHAYTDALSRVVQLRVEHQISNPGLVADITLVDVTAAPVILASFQSNSTQPEQQLTDITSQIVDDSTERVYELRAGLVVGPSYNVDDLVTVWSGALEVVNTF